VKHPGVPRRASWLPRGTTPVTRRNATRHMREWLRAFGSPERCEWIKGLPSVASGETPCENAHVRTGGTSRKADACWIVPLTDYEHRVELHHLGKPAFNAKYGIDLDTEAARIDAMWQELNAA
jgi:hypothetical protein